MYLPTICHTTPYLSSSPMASTVPTTVSPEHLDFQIVHPWVGKLRSQLLFGEGLRSSVNAQDIIMQAPKGFSNSVSNTKSPTHSQWAWARNSSTTIQLAYRNRFWLILFATALKGLNQQLQRNRKCIYQSHPDHFKQVWSPKAQEYSNATTLCPVPIGVQFLFTDRKPLTKNRLTQQGDKHFSILALTHPYMVAKSQNSCFIIMCRLLHVYGRQCYAHSAHCLP